MKFTKHKLKNGLILITVPMPNTPTATAMVLVETGSKYETKENSGISHFLEHLAFKGTPTRPKPGDIAKFFDSLGAISNAFTGKEYTGYYAKADFKHADKIIEAVGDIYLNSLLSEEEIVKEQGVIIEEMNMYDDVPQYQVGELFVSLMYGDTPAGWDVIGTKENVKKFSRADFIRYRSEHYVASATTVVVAGEINEDKVRSLVEKIFSNCPTSRKEGKLKVFDDSSNEPVIKIKHKETDQTHLILGVRTYPILHKDRAVLGVLSTILGGGMSSRLFQKLREDLGICYYVGASNNSFTDHGHLSISAGLDKARLNIGLEAIVSECRLLKNELVKADELRRVKDYTIGQMYLGLESSDDVADFVGFQEILKKEILSPEERAEQIDKVTAEDIKRVAGDIFVDKRIKLAIVGQVSDREAEAIKKLLKF